MASFFPEGLPREIFSILNCCAEDVGSASLDSLLEDARSHLQALRITHQTNRMVNVRLAEAIYAVIVKVTGQWGEIPEYCHYWFCGMIRFFSSTNDYEDDIRSPIGLEDDVDVLNSCLLLAGLDHLVLNPEDFDEV